MEVSKNNKLLHKNKIALSLKDYDGRSCNPVNKKIRDKYYKSENIKRRNKKSIASKNNERENNAISIIIVIDSDNMLDKVFEYYYHQLYKYKEMILALISTSCNADKWLDKSRQHSMIRIYILDYLNSDECIDYCIERAIYKNKQILQEGINFI